MGLAADPWRRGWVYARSSRAEVHLLAMDPDPNPNPAPNPNPNPKPNPSPNPSPNPTQVHLLAMEWLQEWLDFLCHDDVLLLAPPAEVDLG